MLLDLRAGALYSKCSLGLLKLQRLVRIRSVVQLDRLITARRPMRALGMVVDCARSDACSSHRRRQPRGRQLPAAANLLLNPSFAFGLSDGHWGEAQGITKRSVEHPVCFCFRRALWQTIAARINPPPFLLISFDPIGLEHFCRYCVHRTPFEHRLSMLSPAY